MISFRAFKAIDEPGTCESFLEGHVKVLEDYGITNITTNNSVWMRDPNVYCIVALKQDTQEVVGGIRVHVSDEDSVLPVEKAVGNMDGKIYDMVSLYRKEYGVGELCGLWNAKVVAGKGVSLFLIRAGISITNQVNIGRLLTICADYTMHMVTRVGFIVENGLGNNGDFIYPNENYIARVLSTLNSETLETAEEYDRERMLNLRLSPEQDFLEKSPKGGEICINYNLTLK